MRKTLALMVVASFALLASVGLRAQATANAKMVGAEKCAKMCHKVEFTSWLETKHAKAKPRTECETCHGAGADFMKFQHAKDPAKAKTAGLIAKPDKESCARSGCHKPGEIKDDMLAKVHAHKAQKS